MENKSNGEEVQDVTSMDRVIEIYTQIKDSDDVIYRTAALLTFSNQYNYAITIAKEVGDQQGKNRSVSSSSDPTGLKKYSIMTDVDDILEERLMNLLVAMVSSYLSNFEDLPADERIAVGKKNRAKSVIIMLILTNQMNVVPLIKRPRYLDRPISKVYDLMMNLREDSLNNFIDYLRESGNSEMAEIANSVGSKDFWGSEGTKANVMYDRHFGKIRDKIIDPIKTYNAYIKYRGEYRKSSRSIVPSKVFEIFEISRDSFQKCKKTVYSEILEMFPNDVKTIRRLIYE